MAFSFRKEIPNNDLLEEQSFLEETPYSGFGKEGVVPLENKTYRYIYKTKQEDEEEEY